MLRRDFLKLIASSLAASQLPCVEVKHEESHGLDLDATPLEILLLAPESNPMLLARAESHPQDGGHGVIEFDVDATGQIGVVVVTNLATGKEIVALYPGGAIMFNTTYLTTGDTVRLSHDLFKTP